MHANGTMTGKKPYSAGEIYRIACRAAQSMGDMRRGRKLGLLPDTFRERIMLAVTAVNRCALCSYAHTRMALEAGLSQEEIREFVSGEFPQIPDREAAAILFAQHYADSRGKPDAGAWNAVLSAYSRQEALAILGAIRVIMLGNSVGIIFSSLRSRVRGEGGDPRSSLPYELGTLLLLVILLPAGLLQGGIMKLLGLPPLPYDGKAG